METHSHLVAWNQVCKPKDKGGLGIGNIYLRNKALLVNGGGGDRLKRAPCGRSLSKANTRCKKTVGKLD